MAEFLGIVCVACAPLLLVSPAAAGTAGRLTCLPLPEIELSVFAVGMLGTLLLPSSAWYRTTSSGVCGIICGIDMKVWLQQRVTELQEGILYTTVIAVLALGSVALLGAELYFASEHPWFVDMSRSLDLAIAWIFLTDFFLGLLFNRHLSFWQYWRYNWLNLVSSIPISSEAARVLRVLRVLRALRVLRGAMNFWFARQRLRRNRQSVARKAG